MSPKAKKSELERLAAVGRAQGFLMHEMRNTLVMAGLLARNLQKRPKLAKKDRVTVDRIIETINAGEKLIRDSMDLFKPMTGKRSAVGVGNLLQGAVRSVGPLAKERSILVQKDLPRGYRAEILCSRRKFQYALSNILRNAVESMRAGAGVVNIAYRANERRVTIETSDMGRGMSKETLERVFDPFFTTKEDGSGLGLAIAKKIIEDHEGTIRIKSEPKRGTKFTISLPTAKLLKG